MRFGQGSRLGPYEIVAPLGAGGMGEVYRARDTRLDRSVAIKVLPDRLAADPQLRERFEREARAISALNHPHVCVLYDVGRQDDVDFLVLELLDGQTLAERLLEGPLPVTEAVRIAIQIGSALDRAHRSGITHRDLKPANVMLTRTGAKLLDFGLAKPSAPAVAASGLSMLPTTPPNMTTQGTIIGTFQYMAPEQVEGLEADARTDIFAIGALLFEMIAGYAPFQGKTRAALLGAILKDNPPPLSTVQPTTPKTLDRLVTRCLAKDPDDRWQSVRDIVHELEWIAAGSDGEAATAPPKPASGRSGWIGWLVAAALAVAFVAAIFMNRPRSAANQETVQFSIPPPDRTTFGTPTGGGTGIAPQVAISPDGRTIAFVTSADGSFRLWLRPIASTESHLLAGTEGAAFPFWSPDSRSLGFFSNGKMKKVAAAGGPVITLCDAVSGRGGAWSPDNVILFAPSTAGPMLRVSAAGGEPTAASALDTDYAETNHRFPQFLPDGKRFIFTATVGTCCPAMKPGRLRIGTLGSMDAPEIMKLDTSIAIVASGHLLFNRENTLMAQPFDAVNGRLAGERFPIIEGVVSEGSRYISATASVTGTLVYGPRRAMAPGRLVWLSRNGHEMATVGKPSVYSSVSLSPDETKVAVGATTGQPPNRDIWIVDTTTGADRRLTFTPEDDNAPLWSPDGKRIVFQGMRQGKLTLRLQDTTATGGDDLLLDRSVDSTGLLGSLVATDWSRDGRYIVYMRSPGVAGSTDLWVRPMFGEQPPLAVVQGAASEQQGTISPDGRWIAFMSNESGLPQVYVAPFPPAPGRYMVSRDGGLSPQWRADGKELFFMAFDSTIMAATVTSTDHFESQTPHPLFAAAISTSTQGRQYAASRDGSRFLVNLIDRQNTATPFTAVVNWPAAVQR